MNILHLKYAVEIANTKSINKAAERLYVGQPNLSRAVRELEESLGIAVFNRTSKGISITPEGEEFLGYARKILAQIEQVEQLYRDGRKPRQTFSVCVPRASYISDAMAEFSQGLRQDIPAEIFYKETNSMRTVNNVVRCEYNLGIVRYKVGHDKYFRALFEEKHLESEVITDFSYKLLMSEKHPLADRERIYMSDLSEYTEITHGDPYVPSLPPVDVKKEEQSELADKHIYVFERGSQFDLLELVPGAFMWASPVPTRLAEKYCLVQRDCADNDRVYRDVLIYRGEYKLTELDRAFITAVCNAKRKYIKNL